MTAKLGSQPAAGRMYHRGLVGYYYTRWWTSGRGSQRLRMMEALLTITAT